MVNYIKGKLYSTETIVCLVALFVFIQFLFGNAVIGQNNMDVKEAYILVVNSRSSVIIYIMCMLIAMRYPSKYNVMYVLRFGKRKWVISELCSLISMIVLFQLFVVLTCFVWFPRLEPDTWSPVFLASSVIDSGYYHMNIGAIYSFTDWILFSEPMKVFFLSFVLHILLGVLIALICFYCNLYMRVGYGLFIGFALYGMSDILLIMDNTFEQAGSSHALLSLLFLYDNAYIGNLSCGCAEGNLSAAFCIIWYFILIAFFLIIIIDSCKKAEVA